MLAASEREGDNSKGLNDFRLKNGSSQGQNLALTVFYVPSSLESSTEPLAFDFCSLNAGAARFGGEGEAPRFLAGNTT